MQIALSSHNMWKLHHYQCVVGQIYYVCYGRAAATTHMMMCDNKAANTCSIIPHNTQCIMSSQQIWFRLQCGKSCNGFGSALKPVVTEKCSYLSHDCTTLWCVDPLGQVSEATTDVSASKVAKRLRTQPFRRLSWRTRTHHKCHRFSWSFSRTCCISTQVCTLGEKYLFVSLRFERDKKESGVTQPDDDDCFDYCKK